jgi:hypothetical protein
MLTDDEILAHHDASVQSRARKELQLVRKLIEIAKASGYDLLEEEEGEVDDLAAHLFNLDEANVLVYNGERYLGFVKLVFGNDGYDLICDYSTILEEWLLPVNQLANELE